MVRVPTQLCELAVAKDATQIRDLPDRTVPRELIAEVCNDIHPVAPAAQLTSAAWSAALTRR